MASINSVGASMIVCIYGICAAGCNQEPMRALAWRMLFRDIVGMTM